ncbi:hypothetical protein HZS_3052 [Henneguya salminicola]|nr:hypothetical protein HZS_3052 [Henneguya salminicola]
MDAMCLASKGYNLLVCSDFKADDCLKLRFPKSYLKSPKYSKMLELKKGEVLKIIHKKRIGWWIKVSKTCVDINGKEYIKIGMVPSSILVPIKSTEMTYFNNEPSDNEKIEMIPEISKKERKYFPLIFTFYKDYLKSETSQIIKANILSRIFYSWMTFYIYLGFKRYLVQGDLWKPSKSQQLPYLREKFEKSCKKYKRQTDISFFTLFMLNNKAQFLSAFFYKFIQDIIKFLTPFLLNKFILYSNDSNNPFWLGIVFSISIFIVNVLNSLFLNKYYDIVTSLGSDFRYILSSSIYQKMFKINSDHFRDSPVSFQTNLISIDSYKIQEAIVLMNMIWSTPFQIILCLGYLWYIIGLSTLSGLGVILLIIPINLILGRISKKIDSDFMKLKDQRIKLINTVLNGIKLVKLYAWEKAFDNFIGKIRKSELKTLVKKRVSISIVYSFMFLSPILISLASFFTYIQLVGFIDAKIAFVSMSIFSILRFPLTFLPETVSTIVSARVSYSRVKKFLSLPEVCDSNCSYSLTQSEDEVSSRVCVSKADFSFKPNDLPILSNINFKAQPGSLHIIVGLNGSGKTAFLQSLLKETFLESGEVVIHGKLNYVPQQPWIRNNTLRNNIIDENPFNHSKYQKIIDICQLSSDILDLPAGDMTEIGEKGVNLSGGQKQRIGLARALYSTATIYLLDDPFSALDKNVGNKIFQNVISSDGYLSNKIRILTTHNDNFLKCSDCIHIMKNGTIVKSGTYDEIINGDVDFKDFSFSLSSTLETKKDSEPVSVDNDQLKNIGKKYSKSETPPYGGIIDKDTLQKGSINFRIHLQFLKSLKYPLFIFMTISLIISTAGNTISQLFIADYSSNNITKSNSFKFFSIFGGITIIQTFFFFLYATFKMIGNYFSSKTFHHKLLKCLLKSPITLFESTPLGRFINAFSKEMSTIDDLLTNTFMLAIYFFLILLFSLAGIIYTIPYLSIPIFILAIIYYFIQRLYIKSSRQIQRIESFSRAPIISLLVDTYYGLSIIKCNRFEGKFLERFDELLNSNLVSFKMNLCCNRWLGVRLEMIANILIFVCSLVIVYMVMINKITPGSVGFILFTTTSITQTMSFFIRIRCDFENQMVSIERISTFFKIEPEKENNLIELPIKWPTEGSVSFLNYSCCYRNYLKNVLDSINISIQPGQKVAYFISFKVGIVGRTGSGKSSLILSLFRMIEKTEGRIEIDGVDISLVRLEKLRQGLTIIPQDAFIFTGTLRDNIDPLIEYTDDQIWEALKNSQLLNFATSHEEKLAYKIIENGDNIRYIFFAKGSSGEKQLICLTRALLKRTKILVLDEATSNVDMKTDKIIQEIIRTEFSNSTVITVAHRIETIIDYDRYLLLFRA